MLFTLLFACSEPKPAPPSESPPAPAEPVPPAPPATEARVLELDDLGGGGGAPAGMNFIVPPGSDAELVPGGLEAGAKGFRMTVRAHGDALACTDPFEVGPTLGAKVRLRLAGVTTGGQPWMGLNIEARPRDAAGALVSPAGSRYLLLQNLTADAPWGEVEVAGAVPVGAVRAELCFRFVNATGTLEVDRVELQGVAAPAAVGGTRWELDEAGGQNGAPKGAAFLVPPGSTGVETFAGDLGGVMGYRLRVSAPGNALVCTDAFPVAGKMVATGRARARGVRAGGGPYQGFTAEVRSYDAAGALVSPPTAQFIPLKVWTAESDWTGFTSAFTPPAGAATGKLCTRFVEATGVGEVDWLGVAPAGEAVAEGAAP